MLLSTPSRLLMPKSSTPPVAAVIVATAAAAAAAAADFADVKRVGSPPALLYSSLHLVPARRIPAQQTQAVDEKALLHFAELLRAVEDQRHLSRKSPCSHRSSPSSPLFRTVGQVPGHARAIILVQSRPLVRPPPASGAVRTARSWSYPRARSRHFDLS